MSVVDQNEILEEITVSLRNADIFTTTQRNVTTSTTSGSISATSLSISGTQIKNIRSISIGGNVLSFGTDYLVDYDDSGYATISFTTGQNGLYDISYDSGSDKIFPDFPRSDLTLSSFPRMAVDFLDVTTDAGGFGNVNLNVYDFTIAVYDEKKKNVRDYIKAVRQWVVDNQNGLFYMKLMKPKLQGPILVGSFDRFKDKIFQQNLDVTATLNLEKN